MRTVLIRLDDCWHCNVMEQVLEGLRTELRSRRPYLIVDVRRELMDEMRPAMMLFTGAHRTYPALFTIENTTCSRAYGRDEFMEMTLEDIANTFTRSTGQIGEVEGRRPETAAELTWIVTQFLNRTT